MAGVVKIIRKCGIERIRFLCVVCVERRHIILGCDRERISPSIFFLILLTLFGVLVVLFPALNF